MWSQFPDWRSGCVYAEPNLRLRRQAVVQRAWSPIGRRAYLCSCESLLVGKTGWAIPVRDVSAYMDIVLETATHFCHSTGRQQKQRWKADNFGDFRGQEIVTSKPKELEDCISSVASCLPSSILVKRLATILCKAMLKENFIST